MPMHGVVAEATHAQLGEVGQRGVEVAQQQVDRSQPDQFSSLPVRLGQACFQELEQLQPDDPAYTSRELGDLLSCVPA